MSEEPEINLIDYLKVLIGRRKLIGAVIASVTLVTLFYTLVVSPKIYQATASLLPPTDKKDSMGFMSGGVDMSKVSQFVGGISAPATPNDIFLSMLKSRTMADAIIDKFGLMKVYAVKLRESARKRLQNDTRFSVSKEKMISISVEAPSPQLAADIANYYTEYLDNLNRTVNVTSANRNRIFIEQRLNETKANLIKLEDLMQNFQTKHKTVSIEAQASAAISAAAELQARLTAAEVQLEVMKSYLSQNNPDIIRLELQIRELDRQLKKMQYGPGSVPKDESDLSPLITSDPLNPAFNKIPSLGMDLARLTREVRTQEALYTLLISQYEQAKIQESRDTPTVQVLDLALPPERKIKPSIRINLLLALVASAFFSVFLAFFLEYVESIRKKK